MKHFFFSYDKYSSSEGILNGMIRNYIKSEDINDESLKAFYDIADIICDKRFEQKDEELKTLVDGKTGETKKAGNKEDKDVDWLHGLLLKYKGDVGDRDYYRIIALKMIWGYIERQYKIFETSYGIILNKEQQNIEKRYTISISRILYHLVRGNICLRISQCYYENYDLGNSDIWANKAIEILWHGKNLAAGLKDSSSSQKSIQVDLYLRLTKLNLAKYYRDYARRNRRSDFDAALDEFKQVRQRVEDEIGKTSDRAQKRQYVLIWMDAIFNIAKIHRRKYQVKDAKREMIFFYRCLKERIQGEDTTYELIRKADEVVYVKDEINNAEALQDEKDLPRLRIESFVKCDDLDNYDKKRYFLLILLELSRIRRDLHLIENYETAIATAIVADQWSFEMDKRDTYKPGHNIDALITISSSFRKYIKFQNSFDCKKALLRGITITVRDTVYSLYLRDNHGYREGSVASIVSFVGKLMEYAGDGHLKSKAEAIKWHCLYQQNRLLLANIRAKVGDYSSISVFLEEKDLNLQLRFLKGLVFLRSQKYKEAIGIFEELVEPENRETQYIRLGTIGLKARYLLANCYMSRAEYSKAEKILKALKDTLAFAKESRKEQWGSESTDAETDPRVEIDLGYCFMQRGAYSDAIKIYKDMYGVGETSERGTEFRLYQIEQKRRIMGLNNYAACCIFSIDDKEERSGLAVKEKIEIARKIFLYMDEKFFAHKEKDGDIWYEPNPETNLLKGYYTLCVGSVPSNMPITDNQVKICGQMSDLEKPDICGQALVEAHQYFREACRFEEAFTTRYDLVDERGMGNKARYRNEIERISAYIISLTKLYKLYLKNHDQIVQEMNKFGEKTDLEGYQKVTIGNMSIARKGLDYLTMSRRNLERFLLSFPTTYEISMKAAIALAEWLLEYEESIKMKKIPHQAGSNAQSLIAQLYRSFSYITIYEERGARVFNILKDNSKFRFFTATQRGTFLALLLAMYKPIKVIKEECCFNLEDKNYTSKLVHYTRIENLKKLLTDKEEGTAHFQILNCGYMNDVFEGNIFLKGIALVAGSSEENQDAEHLKFIKKYFPQINRSHEDMLPAGSNVYIGSLSVKEDSFPMWSVYAENESGCNIEFGDGFFDVKGSPYFPRALRDYMISKYTDQDYPLYIVQYIREDLEEFVNRSTLKTDAKEPYNDIDFETFHVKGYRQPCGTEAICLEDLSRLFKQIYGRWKQLDKYLEESAKETIDNSQNAVRAFAADRINEIRFLFKAADYEFEGEVRVVCTDFADSSAAKTDAERTVPRVYVDIDREIEGLTVRLGSRIEDATVDKYVTWLKHTKRVQKVGLAKRNRYTT